ncbi:hypothetical protein [Neobacillus drentensis]|uniref:hypothetical protein n=1 Tax=Neobacillus drentensis TaxID=220684 RepID=UPI00285F6260|nr:hypothetical protein [Neobacillus drentensis]MDR7240896.1 hypothetical protein [Neobacillus drentensis]
MSNQTKKESIGYILKGAMDSMVPANRIKDIAEIAFEVVPQSSQIDNYATSNYALRISDEIGLSKDIAADIKSGVWWAFDNWTVEEAGEICEKLINAMYPSLKKRL